MTKIFIHTGDDPVDVTDKLIKDYVESYKSKIENDITTEKLKNTPARRTWVVDTTGLKTIEQFDKRIKDHKNRVSEMRANALALAIEATSPGVPMRVIIQNAKIIEDYLFGV